MNEKRTMDKPELETLDYKPTSAPPEVKRNSTPIIEPETEAENEQVAGQQPNENRLLIEKIQGLTSQINQNITKLNVLGPTAEITQQRKHLISQALEEMDLFQSTTLHEMAEGKAFE